MMTIVSCKPPSSPVLPQSGEPPIITVPAATPEECSLLPTTPKGGMNGTTKHPHTKAKAHHFGPHLARLSAISNNSSIKILLLENVSRIAVELLTAEGFTVEHHPKALSEEALKEKIKDVHVVGIRSKTQLTAQVLRGAKNLLAIGCFCIGTNQVDLDYAREHGIVVFNSPFCNSRSVAELVISQVIALSRQLFDRSTEVHNGQWNKVSARCHEIRCKTLGIVGYGHIGSQLSVLAEALGMNVEFYDIETIMPHGLATPKNSLEDLLASSDFVTLHVPATEDTRNMIGVEQIKLMKRGAVLINASRGSVVDLEALRDALVEGRLSGAAVDVYPSEPRSNGDGFVCPLQGLKNVILTPHIGGSTEEAQCAIGNEVATSLVKYLNIGTSLNAVNFPSIDLRPVRRDEQKNLVRVLNIHRNVPGVLREINNRISNYNVLRQLSETQSTVGYLIADIEVASQESLEEVKRDVQKLPENVMTRLLHSHV